MTTTPGNWDTRAQLYDRTYQEHTELWLGSDSAVLDHFWSGHFSIGRDSFEAMGGFAPGSALGYHEDFDFGRRCSLAGLRGKYAPEIHAMRLYNRSRR